MNLNGRVWVLHTLKRIILSGFSVVQFKDFFVSDLLSSMTYSFVSIETVVCATVFFPNGGYI
jgi:hypothetical protein